MYLRVSKQKRADGSQISHLQFAESAWDPANKRSQVRIVYNFGRAEDPQVIERLRRLANSILKRCAPEEIVAHDPRPRCQDSCRVSGVELSIDRGRKEVRHDGLFTGA